MIGMYLSKFDKEGLSKLGFSNFSEAFNVLGLAINAKPLSIRNYRDEFDPVFPNKRKGWHKRPMFKSRKEMLEKYNRLTLVEFTEALKRIIYQNPDVDLIEEKISESDNRAAVFAKRLITGQAAEQYFRDNYRKVTVFRDAVLEDTTKYGCGFDFKLNFGDSFYAVEVKGLEGKKGNVGLTNKEYQTATFLRSRYFIFLVKNFVDVPNHCVFKNPIFENELQFKRQEKIITQINWTASIA